MQTVVVTGVASGEAVGSVTAALSVRSPVPWANPVPHPEGDAGSLGWPGSWGPGGNEDVVTVTSVPGVLWPKRAGTALYAAPCDGGSGFENDYLNDQPWLPDGAVSGDYVAFQVMVLSTDVLAVEAELEVSVGWFEADGTQYASYTPIYESDPVPGDEFTLISGVLQVPANSPDLERFTLYITHNQLVSGGADNAGLYITMAQADKVANGSSPVPAYRKAADGSASWVQYGLRRAAEDAFWQVPGPVRSNGYADWYQGLAVVTSTKEATWKHLISNPVLLLADADWAQLRSVRSTVTALWTRDRREDGGEVTELDTVVSMNGHDWNDGAHTFLMPGAKLPRHKPQFDEVRSYTGNIRQVDVHEELTETVIPLKVIGDSPSDLEARLDVIRADCLAGGTLVWQDGAGDGDGLGPVQSFTVGVSEEPDIERNRLYRHKNTAIFEVNLNVAPWW